MKYYTKEIWNEEGYQRTAGIKARDDVDVILEKNGYKVYKTNTIDHYVVEW